MHENGNVLSHFSALGQRKGTPPFHVVFVFLLHWLDKGLPYASLKVYLAAISAHHLPQDSHSVFSHPLMKQFLKGLAHSCPILWRLALMWDLPLVLQGLILRPFEPMATAALHLLTWNKAFLVVITLAR